MDINLLSHPSLLIFNLFVITLQMHCRYIFITKDYTKTCQRNGSQRFDGTFAGLRFKFNFKFRSGKCPQISAIRFFLRWDQNFGIAFGIRIGFLLQIIYGSHAYHALPWVPEPKKINKRRKENHFFEALVPRVIMLLMISFM